MLNKDNKHMFWFISDSGKWLADVANSAINVEWISSYMQNIRTILPSLEGLKLSPIRSVFKFFFTTEQLPQRVNSFAPAYEKIRLVAIKVGKPIQSTIMSKKTSSVLAGLGTATSLVAISASWPIILVGSVFAAWSSSRAETRGQINAALAKRIANLEKAEEKDVRFVHTLDIKYGTQQLVRVSFKDQEGNVQVIEAEELEKYYSKPGPAEIVKMGLDIGLAGIVAGTSSFRLASTVATCAYSIYSGRKQSKAMKEGTHALRERIKKAADKRARTYSRRKQYSRRKKSKATKEGTHALRERIKKAAEGGKRSRT
jgi:hypothetical protein